MTEPESNETQDIGTLEKELPSASAMNTIQNRSETTKGSENSKMYFILRFYSSIFTDHPNLGEMAKYPR